MKLGDFTMNVLPQGWKAPKEAKSVAVETEKPLAAAGTQIICPKCKAPIGRFFAPIYSGMHVPAEMIEFEKPQIRHKHEQARCKVCDAAYIVHNASLSKGWRVRIHTQLGWI